MVRHRSTAHDLHIGKRTKLLRKARLVRQTDLAKTLGITVQQLQKYENGSNRISAGCLLEIATALEVTVAYFYEGLHGTVATLPAPPVRDRAKVAALFAQIKNEAVRDEIISLLNTLVDED